MALLLQRGDQSLHENQQEGFMSPGPASWSPSRIAALAQALGEQVSGSTGISAEPPPRPSGGYCRLASGRSVGKPVVVDGPTSESVPVGPLVSPLS